MKLAKTLLAGVALAAMAMGSAASAADMKIALVVKSLGNGFFEAANKGAQEAAKELGGVEIIYTGPTSTTAEGQIEVINSLIAQGVDAIAISANDPDAVVPALKKAAQRGIKVISWDSGVAPEGRIMHLNPSSNELIGKMCLKLAADHLPEGKGDFAILSATTTSTNQNIWIEEMKKQLKDFPGLNLVTTVYGDDLADKSYREANGLLSSSPNVKVIVAPTTVGVLAASQAVKDAGKIGDVYVTGLGLPSEMAGAIKSGATKEFAIWNPIDLGYSATQIAYHLVKGDTDGAPGSEIEAGRMGKIKIGDTGEAAMADPFVYDASNIDQFSKIF
ncbi:rhamnose ABC transporter substrate-binding protein [Rhizobium cremeum]|uniref:Rhamnose ABC transporter substrate-binding protein n=1 Tax=Ciceribacter sichuanensis TaxID=2949647 RepID=A0AAJ1BZV2_9HYPH|nr:MULTISPECIES: rhamnose ABC transporter substrate-binding protein [Rhizobiaceae]MCJ7995507.1 rhamnose ABC transporter substrate-binding protein [Rhizobium cremeum]MCJ8001005.1 rhamnose ABC transporter substrate-binding protein [Rhizobium cremeum]MCM2397263.1 rhamnose ABC transporter substrate-binding protein [Ciceribacter sp. S95]MCM2403388.1 rhamnose ABC transporter substrate-binding protein [Ciceribacter sp. S153]MCO5959087.1 rhamnose ABC transporter substrate-binding protein [Ciceribacter